MVLGYKELTKPERAVWEAVETGRLVDLRVGDPEHDDPARGAAWDADRQVRAQLLHELLTGISKTKDTPPRALRLAGAWITGALDLEAVTLLCPLLLRGCYVDRSITLEEARAPALRLPGCHVASLHADQLETRGNVELDEGFTAQGEVRLLGAHIGGTLDLRGASLTNPNGHALQLQELRAGALVLRDLTEPPALVEFTHAQVGALVDEPESWPRQAILDGFIYDALYEDPPVSAHRRLRWLARNPRGYSPQPYEQLAGVYRRAGRDQDARTVAIAKQRARRRTLGLPGRLWSLLLDGLVGYGYRTWLAGVWLLGFWLFGWALFDRAHAHRELVLARPGEAHPGFHGAVYALDTLLPVVDLRQQAVWIPRGGVQWWAWASILAGWVLTTAVVAALTGLLKRDQ